MASLHKIGTTLVSDYARESDVELGVNDLAGASTSVPYQPGLRSGTRTLKGRDYPLYLSVIGVGADDAARTADYHTKVQALAALILNPDSDGYPQAYVLTRMLPLTAGLQTCTINARYSSGLRWARVAPWIGRAVPILILLDGWWLTGSTKVYA
jgi:hypothetical protein